MTEDEGLRKSTFLTPHIGWSNSVADFLACSVSDDGDSGGEQPEIQVLSPAALLVDRHPATTSGINWYQQGLVCAALRQVGICHLQAK